MSHVDTVIIGGGQAGLAMSRSLAERGVEHVVLEKGLVGERWRNERWESLHLLTPRWLSRLSGWTDDDRDPNGFMDRSEVIEYLDAFASMLRTPILTGVTVLDVARVGAGYRVRTDSGDWTARHVVIATGQSQGAFVPALADDLAPSVRQVLPTEYRRPSDLEDGGVLVVGASATGIQLAAEIHASGRPVTLAVGKHTRLPRTYRGQDILWWFDRMGILDHRTSDVRNLHASRDQPSMQLTGSCDHRTLDLSVLQKQGVRFAGRADSADGTRVGFDDCLVESAAAADFKLAGLRRRIEGFIRDRGLASEVGDPEPFDPVIVTDGPDQIDLRNDGIRTVLWATGFRRSYPWLNVPVLDGRGEIVHTEGITSSPGLYVLGLNFMRRRTSSFIAGVGRDAAELADHLVRHRLGRRWRRIGSSDAVSQHVTVA